MKKENITLKKYGVYYLPRKVLEDGLSNKIKFLKKKIKNIEDVLKKESIYKELKSYNSKRPCLIINIYGANVTIIPLTRSDNDESHIRLPSQDTKKSKSYAKISVIKTLSVNRFKNIMEWTGNKRITSEEISIIKEAIVKHHFK